MKPPYTITPSVLQLVAQVSELLGRVRAVHLQKPQTELRKKNRIKTIQASLQIEGNTLTLNQVTAVFENKRVLAPAKDITEVTNAIKVYEQLNSYNPLSQVSFCKAHDLLMHDLIAMPGRYRSGSVGITKGKNSTHIAPPASRVPALMNQLFDYVKKDKEIMLIKSCVFHYELEFIHPFTDGNGRMGRLWQTLLLMRYNPVFEYLPIESLIKNRQKKYYEALSASDKAGNSTPFVEFMLLIIHDALQELLATQNRTLTAEERLELFKDQAKKSWFTRKHYLTYFNNISTATASRDVNFGVENKLLTRKGEKNKAVYRFL